jgi:hypothetical protein
MIILAEYQEIARKLNPRQGHTVPFQRYNAQHQKKIQNTHPPM